MSDKLKSWIIKKIAGDMPVVHGFHINVSLVKDGAYAVYIPEKSSKIPTDELIAKAVLTPIRNAR